MTGTEERCSIENVGNDGLRRMRTQEIAIGQFNEEWHAI